MKAYRPVPLTLAEANAFVAALHRHHLPVQGHRFSLGAWCEVFDELVGVCIVGRPVARRIDQNAVCEVTRLCTNGRWNACSFLYGVAARVAKEMGFARILTYTLPSEGGASLRGARWIRTGDTPGRSWSVPSRPREDKAPLGVKHRWEKILV